MRQIKSLSALLVGATFVCTAGLLGPTVVKAEEVVTASEPAATSEAPASAETSLPAANETITSDTALTDASNTSSPTSADANADTDPSTNAAPEAAAANEAIAANTEPADTSLEAPKEAVIAFMWEGKEVFRENVANGKQVHLYTDDTKTAEVNGSPLTVDTTKLDEDLRDLLVTSDLFKAGYTTTWSHTLDKDGNLYIWPTYTKKDTVAPGTEEDKAPYHFKFKWVDAASRREMPWYFTRVSILNKQSINKITAEDVKNWLDSIYNGNSAFIIDENQEFAPADMYGAWEFVGLEGEYAMGTPEDSGHFSVAIGYWKRTPLNEYYARLEKEKKEREEAAAAAAAAAEAEKNAEYAASDAVATDAAETALDSTLKSASHTEKSVAKPVAAPAKTVLPKTGDLGSGFSILASMTGLLSLLGAGLMMHKKH